MSAAVTPGDQPDGGGQPGRRRATSQAELEHVAFDLFEANGFEQTTVEDIATKLGYATRSLSENIKEVLGMTPRRNSGAGDNFLEPLLHGFI